jgi:hypothetical protein
MSNAETEVNYDTFYAQCICLINMALSGFPSRGCCSFGNLLSFCLGKFSCSCLSAILPADTSKGLGREDCEYPALALGVGCHPSVCSPIACSTTERATSMKSRFGLERFGMAPSCHGFTSNASPVEIMQTHYR